VSAVETSGPPRSVPELSGPELSIVVPVYNEAENIPIFLDTLVPILREHVASYEIIFALDPCPDRSEQVIAERHEKDPNIKLVVFSRRFGQPTATMAGIELSSGRAVVVMDVDMQDPPTLIGEMVAKWREGYEVVYAQRNERAGERWIKKLVAAVGYRVIDRFGDVPIPRDTGDFRLLDRKVVDQLMRFPESHGFLRGLVALVGFKQTAVRFDRPARHAGKGNYNQFVGSLRIGFNGLIAFSSALLSLSTVLGFIAAAGAFLTAIAYIIAKLAGAGFPLGNATIVVLVLFMGGINLICLGIMGQYVGRIYDEVKRRPRFIVQRAYGFSNDIVTGGR
jgi:polyisoprenyl-phosphate glycosyltransferase